MSIARRSIPTGGVFINYRGADSGTTGALIYKVLSARFGPGTVFLDNRSIRVGEDFVDVLLRQLRLCSVMLVVIGPRWTTVADKTGKPRLFDPNDWVCREIHEALKLGLTVIPVLLDGVQIPAEDVLPETIAELSRRQYVHLRNRYADEDLSQLCDKITAIDPSLAEAAQQQTSDPRCRVRFSSWLPRLAAIAVCLVGPVNLVVFPHPVSPVPHEGRSGGGPSSTQSVSPDIVGDERTADPCSLIDPTALRRFGVTELRRERGNFDQCTVEVGVGDASPVDVEIRLAAYVQQPVPSGVAEIERYPQENGRCVRRVRVTDRHDAWIVARTSGRAVELCGIAEAATRSAVTALRRGPISRRTSPFTPASLANIDACTLLDRHDLARLTGIDASRRQIHFGGWRCGWTSPIDETGVQILFDRRDPFDSTSTPVDVETSAGQLCTARTVHQEIPSDRGGMTVESVIVLVRGAHPGVDNCATARELAETAVENLPPPPPR